MGGEYGSLLGSSKCLRNAPLYLIKSILLLYLKHHAGSASVSRMYSKFYIRSPKKYFRNQARFFLLVDLRKFFSILGSGRRKKK